MGTPTLSRVAPVSASVREVQQGPAGQGERRRGRPRRSPGRGRLVAAALPGQDPETCDVLMGLDAEGALCEVTIVDRQDGTVLARLGPADVVRILGDGGHAGLFFERSG